MYSKMPTKPKNASFFDSDCQLRILLTVFYNIDNGFADNQQIMQKIVVKLIAELVSQMKVKEKVGEIWFIRIK